jgi:Flp pilus assembly protein TadG
MNRKHSQRGAVALEFGLAFLFFFALLYGVMEFGRIVASYNILSGAAREGARYAIVHGSASGSAASSSDIQTIVRNWSIGLDTSAVTVNTSWNPGNGPGGQVTVTASYTVTPFTGLLIGNGITLQSTSAMVISQ